MELLKENELSANKAAALVMRITVAVFALVLVLDIIGVFTVEVGTMTVAFIIGTILLLVPTILANVLKLNGGWVKYVIVLCAVLFTMIATVTLAYHVVLLYVYPIAIASLYFSGKLNIFTSVLTIVCVSVGQILAFNFNFVADDNYTTLKETIMHGILPRALILFAISAIFTMLCKRTTSMLGSLMGAEQQRIMREKSLAMSHKLLETVTELEQISADSAEANRSIADESENVMRDSETNAGNIKAVEENMNSIAESLQNLSDMSAKIAALTKRADEVTAGNNSKIALASESMNEICKGTDESKEIISRLSDQSKQIVDIAKVITDISMQTNILAINASIEASRAGEAGQGFSVVASEIKKLSEETKSAAAEIGEIIESVTENISATVAAMENSSLLTREGMNSMEQMKIYAEKISSSTDEISKHISDMNNVIESVAANGENALQKLVGVSSNIENNCGAVQHVAAAIEESSAGTEALGVMVKNIKSMAEELEMLTK